MIRGDYLLQSFERFVEKHYARDRKIRNLLVFRLSDRPGNEETDPYIPVSLQHKFEGANHLHDGVRLKFDHGFQERAKCVSSVLQSLREISFALIPNRRNQLKISP